MNTSSVLAIIGGAALFMALVGGGIEAEKVRIPKIPSSLRATSGLLGIVLIGISVKLSLPASPLLAPTMTFTVPTSVPPTQVLQVTQIVPVTQVVPFAEIVNITPFASTSVSQNISEYQIKVDGSKLWQDTGIMIDVGDQVTIRYISGLWGTDSQDANGIPNKYICADWMPASECTELVPDAIQGSLVGKVGTQILRVGEYLDFTAEQSDSLILSRNQDVVGFMIHGEVGEIIVLVTVHK